ncbi:helix-turn-helix domain-containing protein [Thermomonospora cellulosilytica]|uniref:Transcriptional regulator with XRE-family HTH domain n=1 Tax=Thermomonospora cellulosilytica TaxID=1411118 RepID=A0A7W3MVI4_9ACTN|nr:helix-turn-helix transcriptional regulator [Thermomonospora cellulosilytica]MBA9002646.1 transcriptional regulator with XRE-family HTH domain [Thermomonospora cellulosilytica]
MKLDPQRAGQDRRQLAAALRDLRKASGLSGERLARRCGMSQSKISRIENGRLLPSVVDVVGILTALGVDRDTREALTALARVANTEYQDLRSSVRRGLHHRQRELTALEENTAHARYFLPALITGLLQTPQYMRTAMSPPIDPATADVSKAVAMKLGRQAILHDGTKRFEFLLTESAIRWRLCAPSVMAVQLDHLVSVSRLPSVRLGVLPLSRQVPDGAYHTFTVYDDRLVTVELFTGRLVLRDPKDIGHYRSLFGFFSSHAVWADEARVILQAVADTFRDAE